MVRFKNRYITVKIISASDNKNALILKTFALQNTIINKVQQMYGDFGVAAIKAGFNAKYCNAHTKIAIIKCRHRPHELVLNCLPKITEIGGHAVTIKIIYIGATLKHCYMFIKKHNVRILEKAWSKLKSEADRKKLEEAIMTLAPVMKDFT